jgi:hypothetical protein
MDVKPPSRVKVSDIAAIHFNITLQWSSADTSNPNIPYQIFLLVEHVAEGVELMFTCIACWYQASAKLIVPG